MNPPGGLGWTGTRHDSGRSHYGGCLLGFLGSGPPRLRLHAHPGVPTAFPCNGSAHGDGEADEYRPAREAVLLLVVVALLSTYQRRSFLIKSVLLFCVEARKPGILTLLVLVPKGHVGLHTDDI